MSRYCGDKDSVFTLSAAEIWKKQCLIDGESLFFDEKIWTSDSIQHLQKYYVSNLDTGDGNFLEKLEKQLERAPVSAKKLCAELLWVILLCPSNIGPDSKRKTLSTVFAWSDQPLDKKLLSDESLQGVGGGGPGYNQHRWRELVFLINFTTDWLALEVDERKRLASDAKDFSNWLETIKDVENRQLRYMLLFMLFPDDYERIFAKGDRKKILEAFAGISKKAANKYNEQKIDQELSNVRIKLIEQYKTEQLDWYVPPLVAFWLDTSKKGETESERIYPELSRFLEQAQTASQKTATYPKKHAGLTMRVSFGTGNLAHVAWIGFLADGQTPTKGIYPVYLYFKADKLLILAKGISDTNVPNAQWNEDDLSTIDVFFQENYSKRAIRYGESFVFESYDLSTQLDEEKIEDDLARLLNEYKNLVLPDQVQEPTAEYTVEKSQGDASEVLSLSEIMKGVFLPLEKIESTLAMLRAKKNIVLQGPPGVGKTFIGRKLAAGLMGCIDRNRVEMVQFHQSYAYEDFIQGYRPAGSGFELKNGLFHQFCTKASKDIDNEYVFIIDEINRGNLSKVFGEMMMLIEADKRGVDWQVPLAYSKDLNERFFVPENVYIVGLMNTADRSLSMVDYALRRRFAFFNLEPQFSSEGFSRHLLEMGATEAMIENVILRVVSLNNEIRKDEANLGAGFCIGHSFFCGMPENGVYDNEHFKRVVEFEITPLLQEYWFDDPDRVKKTVDNLLA